MDEPGPSDEEQLGDDEAQREGAVAAVVDLTPGPPKRQRPTDAEEVKICDEGGQEMDDIFLDLDFMTEGARKRSMKHARRALVYAVSQVSRSWHAFDLSREQELVQLAEGRVVALLASPLTPQAGGAANTAFDWFVLKVNGKKGFVFQVLNDMEWDRSAGSSIFLPSTDEPLIEERLLVKLRPEMAVGGRTLDEFAVFMKYKMKEKLHGREEGGHECFKSKAQLRLNDTNTRIKTAKCVEAGIVVIKRPGKTPSTKESAEVHAAFQHADIKYTGFKNYLAQHVFREFDPTLGREQVPKFYNHRKLSCTAFRPFGQRGFRMALGHGWRGSGCTVVVEGSDTQPMGITGTPCVTVEQLSWTSMKMWQQLGYPLVDVDITGETARVELEAEMRRLEAECQGKWHLVARDVLVVGKNISHENALMHTGLMPQPAPELVLGTIVPWAAPIMVVAANGVIRHMTLVQAMSVPA